MKGRGECGGRVFGRLLGTPAMWAVVALAIVWWVAQAKIRDKNNRPLAAGGTVSCMHARAEPKDMLVETARWRLHRERPQRNPATDDKLCAGESPESSHVSLLVRTFYTTRLGFPIKSKLSLFLSLCVSVSVSVSVSVCFFDWGRKT